MVLKLSLFTMIYLSVRVFECIFNSNKKIWLWSSHFPSLPQKQLQGSLWEKVGGETKSFAWSYKCTNVLSCFPETTDWLTPVLWTIAPPYPPPLKTPPSELTAVLGLHWFPYLKTLRSLSVMWKIWQLAVQTPHTRFSGPSWSYCSNSVISCLWELNEWASAFSRHLLNSGDLAPCTHS